MNLIVVTGTGTDVGKTVAAAALTVCAMRAGRTVAVVKPVQTGLRAGEPGDLAEVERLTGHRDLHEFHRYAEPLAPATAARRLGDPGCDIQELSNRIDSLSDRDLVIVEGAGGAMVRLNSGDQTLIDLIALLQLRGTFDVQVLLVAAAGLGVLNSAALTASALDRRGLRLHGVVIGDWPAHPTLAERCNLTDLSSYAGAAVRGIIASSAGRLDRAGFAAVAVRSFTPSLGGTLDAPTFIRGHSAPRPTKEVCE